MKNKCNKCNTEFEFTKKDIKRKIAFKKGEISILLKMEHIYIPAGFFWKGGYDYQPFEHTYKCEKNQYDKFISCPACEEKIYFKQYCQPYYSSVFGIQSQSWKLINKEKR